ncbi:copper chaperone PCu(A)C [Blastococcus sp. Marseille-P5729]|uniref:copper chaperone PCu(A)C n=1 Tax=Blastococcus sp. Marseille-P5729 TaxID=2086582 RepID=UPI000D0F8160|nr:copper chaperone PCu(A)C [Blastococcus sp. Marseille-P5729]
MSADPQDPGKLSVRLVVALLAVILGATALVIGLTRGDDPPPELPADAVRQGDIAVYGAYVREPATDTAAAYFTMQNVGDQPDTLIAVSSPVAASAMMHDVGKKAPTAEDGMDTGSMVPSPTVVLKAGQVIALEPGGGHMMLEGVTGTIAPGSTVNLMLVFEKAGTLTIKAPVVGLTEPAPSTPAPAT